MKQLLPILITLGIGLMVSSCGPSLKVTSDYDKAINFGQYKTYSIYQPENINDAISELNRTRIINSIKGEMTKKGFQEAASNPDLLVNTTAIFKDRVSVSSTTNYYGFGGYYRPYYYGAGGGGYNTTNYDINNYKDGSLIIDVLEASSKKVVWTGVGNREIDKPLKDPDTQIPKAIGTIMASFPPGAAKKK